MNVQAFFKAAPIAATVAVVCMTGGVATLPAVLITAACGTAAYAAFAG